MNRRGTSLVEMVVVISVSSALMVVAVGWIHQSLKLGSIMDQRQEHHQSVLRLARQLAPRSGRFLAIRKTRHKTPWSVRLSAVLPAG